MDGIITDGMRVATEVRRRMDEAQKELEKNALPGQKPDDDDEDDEDIGIAVGVRKGPGSGSGDSDRRSVKSSDLDLLSGADAEAGAVKEQEASLIDADPHGAQALPQRPATTNEPGVVEFEG
jgi:hypothetical protein